MNKLILKTTKSGLLAGFPFDLCQWKVEVKTLVYPPMP